MTDISNFQARAAAATTRALSATNPAEALAKSLTDADMPKITTAAKNYASLVAARSLTTSQTDAAPASTEAAAASNDGRSGGEVLCTFHKTENPGKASLLCARALLLVINSTEIPDSTTSPGSSTSAISDQNLEREVVRIVWNGLVKKYREGGADPAASKPSMVLGRRSLVHAYPQVLERIRRGEGEEGGDGGETSLLPANVDHNEAMAFFEEFGKLLLPLGSRDNENEDDDGELIWSIDGGTAELGKRRERRDQRGKEAVAAAKADAKAALVASASSSLTIEELPDEENDEVR
mmetsp:Transcript_19594/g.42662  ORF Transcript_19594/g.42662 Transcript_19594/m.42662 type:complete len:294 (-) Transcript_19594:3905-4786(-)